MMQRPRVLLVSPFLLCAALAACSSGGSSSPAASVSADSADTTRADTSPADTTAAASSSSPAAPVTSAAATSAAPAPAGGSVITFTGFLSGRMTATDCEGGIAQLAVDIDGQPTTYTGIIDADDFTFVAPRSTGYTIAKEAAKPKVTGGGTTFTVSGTKLVRITGTSSDGHPDATITATGSVTCP